MLKKIILFIFILLFINILPQKVILKGFITDQKSGEALIGVNILDSNQLITRKTNSYGYYTLECQKGENILYFSLKSHSSRHLKIIINKDTTINLTLKRIELQDTSAFYENTTLSKLIPIKFGISSTITESAVNIQNLSVNSQRHCEQEQDLIIIDEVPIYNVNHLFYLLPTFNDKIINSLTNINVMLPARYDGRLTSVTDITTIDGNKNKYSNELHAGNIYGSFISQGPLFSSSNSYLISARRSYFDYWLSPIVKSSTDDKTDFSYYFYDINAKINFRINPSTRLYFSVFMVNDKFDIDQNFKNDNKYTIQTDWGNKVYSLRLIHSYSDALFGSLSMSYTKFNYNNTNSTIYNSNTYKIGYKSEIDDYNFQLSIDYIRDDHQIKFGFQNKILVFNTIMDILNTKTSQNIKSQKQKLTSNKLDAFAEDSYIISEWLNLNIGMRVCFYAFSEDKMYSSMQPRMTINIKLANKLEMSTSFYQANQYILCLNNNSVGLPADIWLAANKNVKPEKTLKGGWGLKYNISDNYIFKIEGYYNRLDNLIEYNPKYNYTNAGESAIDDRIIQGSGRLWNISTTLQKECGVLSGMLIYSYTKSQRNFSEFIEGEDYPFKTERAHKINILADWRLTTDLKINFNWIYNSGDRFSLANEKYSGLNNETLYNSLKNNYLSDPYHRLDLNIIYKTILFGTNNLFNLSIINIYNNINTVMIVPDLDSNENRYIKVGLIPFMPSIGWKIIF